ncbi:MAG: 3-deoxy-D-manno-octulosonic acid transferase [bacterium JZ-2024 1]
MGRNPAKIIFGASLWVLYNLLSLLLLPLIFLYLSLRWKQMGNWLHRLGWYPDVPHRRVDVWVHMVSVGEARAGTSLIRSLREEYPEIRLLLSTFTTTGRDFLLRQFPDIPCIYAPLDFFFSVLLFYLRFRPHFSVLVETEIWPNYVVFSRFFSSHLIIVNGRISDRFFALRFFLFPFWSFLLSFFDYFFMRGPLDVERLKKWLGEDQRIVQAGDLKTELNLQEVSEQAKRLLQLFPQLQGRKILTAGSTHAGEEEILLEVWKSLREEDGSLFLILAPRHPERAESLFALFQKKGCAVALRSHPSVPQPTLDVLIIDGIGELVGAYFLSEVAFVGGSLIPRGGHNPMEPALLGKPVIFGSSMENFRESAARLIQSGGARQVASPEELKDVLRDLFRDSEKRKAMGFSSARAFSDISTPSKKILLYLRKYLR